MNRVISPVYLHRSLRRLSALSRACLFLLLIAGLQAQAQPSITLDNFGFISADPIRNPDGLPINSGDEYMDAGGTWNGMVEVTNTSGDTFRLTITNSADGAPDPLTDDVAFDIGLALNVPVGFRLPFSPFTVDTAAAGGDAGAGNCTAPGGGTITATQAGGPGTPITFVFPANTDLPGGSTPCAYTLEFGLTSDDAAPFPAAGPNTLGYTFSYNETDDDPGSRETVDAQTDIEVQTGDVIVTKTAVPNPSNLPDGGYADGETAEWTVSVFNNGTGGTFAVLVDDTPNGNFDIATLQLTPPASPPGTPFPVPQGIGQYTIAYLEPGEQIDITVRAEVAVPATAMTCPDLRNDVAVQDRLGNTSSDFDSVVLDLQDPLLDYDPPNFTINYGTPTTVSFTVSNPGLGPDGGTARNIILDVSGLNGVTISNVSSEWIYDVPTTAFIYVGPDGTPATGDERLLNGDSSLLQFDAVTNTCDGPTGGSLTWRPDYENICGLNFSPPIQNSTYSVNNFPGLTIDKSVTPTSTNFGEPATYTIDLIGFNVSALSTTAGADNDWDVTDTLPFGVGNGNIPIVPAGTIVTVGGTTYTDVDTNIPVAGGDTIVWRGDRDDLLPLTPSLTIDFIADSTGFCPPAPPVTFTNTVLLNYPSCSIIVGDSAGLLVNDSPIDSADQVFGMAGGLSPPFETGRPDTDLVAGNEPNEGERITFTASYQFPAGYPGIWSGSSFNAEMGTAGITGLNAPPLQLAFVDGNGNDLPDAGEVTGVIVEVINPNGPDYGPINLPVGTGPGEVTINLGGDIEIDDLAFIEAAIGSASMDGTTLNITYHVTAPEGNLGPDLQPTDGVNIGIFDERVTLSVVGNPNSCAGNNDFTQGIAVPLDRASVTAFGVIEDTNDAGACGPTFAEVSVLGPASTLSADNIRILLQSTDYDLPIDAGDFVFDPGGTDTGNLAALNPSITFPVPGDEVDMHVTPNDGDNLVNLSTFRFPLTLDGAAVTRVVQGQIFYDSNHTSPDFDSDPNEAYSTPFFLFGPPATANLDVEFFPPSITLGEPTLFAEVDPGIPGQEGVYSWLVRITNTGTSTVSGYIFTNEVPPGYLPYRSGSNPAADPGPLTDPVMVWSGLPDLPPGGSTQVRVAIGLAQNAGCNVGNPNQTNVYFGCTAGTVLFSENGPAINFPVIDLQLRHLNNSFCELCREGYVDLVVSNDGSSDLYNVTITETLAGSGLEYAGRTDVFPEGGASYTIAADPHNTAGDTALTWDSDSIPELARLYSDLSNTQPTHLTIRFYVRSSDLNPEDLLSASRQIQATADFDLFCGDPGLAPVQDTFTVPLHQPEPVVEKLGRNFSARQSDTQYSDPVFGGTDDVLVWRVDVQNSGNITSADLEDLLVNDTIGGNFTMRYVCPSEAAATAMATALETELFGAQPAPAPLAPCIAYNPSLDVDDPFGNPGGDQPGAFVDVQSGANAYVYYVGEIAAFCTNHDNTADIEWGCEVAPPAGGINAGTLGVVTADDNDSAEMSTSVDPSGVQLAQTVTGTNPAQPLGTKGIVTVTITNNSGGTIRDLVLEDILPQDYELDPEWFTVHPDCSDRITINTAYSAGYPGQVDECTHINSALPTGFTAPRFRFTSSTQGTPNQLNLLRNGDQIILELGIVRVRPFDTDADPETREETPGTLTDPDYSGAYTNDLQLDFENTCSTTFNRDPAALPVNVNPEDLDVDINEGNPDLFYILADPAATLQLDVSLRNRGGHDAGDYDLYVTVGEAMNIVSINAGGGTCTLLTGAEEAALVLPPPARDLLTSNVYRCVDQNPLPPNGQDIFQFVVERDVPDTTGDLTFRADVIGRTTQFDGNDITLNPGEPGSPNYSLDNVLARIIGFAMSKTLLSCNETGSADPRVMIGEECTYRIQAEWFGFATPGFGSIEVRNVSIFDGAPGTIVPPQPIDGQGSIGNPDTSGSSTGITVGSQAPANPVGALSETGFRWDLDTIFTNTGSISETFVADVTFRTLNEPVNSSAAPNQHGTTVTNEANARFEVFFPDTGSAELFDEGSAGYPPEEDRQAAITIIEPNITITKEICNESVSIANNPANEGANCQPFIPSPPNVSGDSDDEYIYRITVTNEATANGFDRAPAFDVVINDVFDPTDQIAPFDFTTDDLDNDGDGLVDALDLDGEGTVDNTILADSDPADITISGTHSSPLARIDAGDSVQLLYRARLDSMVTPTQQLTNTADGGYDSLPGDFGSQSAPQRNNGDIGGAREYDIAPVQAVLEVDNVTVSPGSKSIPLSSRTDDPSPFGGIQLEADTCLATEPVSGNCINRAVVIGEEVEVELEFTLPLSDLREFTLEDILPDGLECIEAEPITLPTGTDPGFSPGGTFPAVCDATRVFWDLSTDGDQTLQGSGGTAQYTLQARFIARVRNIAGIDNGAIIRNGGSSTNVLVSYRDASNTPQTISIDEASLTVREPNLAVTKTLDPVPPNTAVDAVDRINVTVRIDNNGTSPAYNIELLDTLDANLSFVAGSIGGTNPPDDVDLSAPARPRFTFDNPLPAGNSYTFTFQVQADGDVRPLEQLNNTIDARYSSLPANTVALNASGVIGTDGATNGMRVGFLPSQNDPVNDYEARDTDFETVPPLIIVKNDLNPAAVNTIGARKHFQLLIDLPESAADGVVVNDNLANGAASFVLENNAVFDITYSFRDIASINGVPVAGLATPADVEAALAAFTATDGATGAVIWNFGTVITATEDDAATNTVNPRIVIDYYARIANEPGTTSGVNLQNAAGVDFTDGESGGTATANAPLLGPYAVVEPDLQVTKNFVGLGPGAPALPPGAPANTVIQGHPAIFDILVTNVGTSAAWDTTVIDVLPNRTDAGDPGGMCANAPVITQIEVNGRGLLAGTDYTVTFTPPASPADLSCRFTVVLTPADSGAPADNARIEPGETLLIRYETTPDFGTPNSSNLTNVAGASEWFSLDTDGLSSPPEIRRYSPPVTLPPDPNAGTVGTADNQDAETVQTLSPILDVTKSVMNVTTGQAPALTASPGDTLRYTIVINNTGPVDALGLQITDEPDALNALNYPDGYFENSPAGTLRNILVNGLPPGLADDFSDPNGGGNGSGLLDIRNQDVPAGGSLTVTFDIDLEDPNTPLPRAMIQNNASVSLSGLNLITSNTTQTEITGVRAAFEFEKISQDVTGDASVLATGDTLRYTITIKNEGYPGAGLTHAVNVLFRDQVPANTTYVANSTFLNGQPVTDPAAGVPPFADGMPVNSPDVTTPGFMTANPDPADTSNVARVSFDVTINGGLVNGTIISNQGLLTGQQQALTPFTPMPFSPAISDDPRTVDIVDDPTQDVVGSGVNVDVLKTVEVISGGDTIPDTGETLRYTIIAVNRGNVAATNARLVDPLPAGVTFVPGSVTLNGNAVADNGVSPLIAGIAISSDDLTPPAPEAGEGVLSAGGSAIVTFDVNITAANGVTISNQATVRLNEQPDEPSDNDGNDENGDQSTTVVVGGRPDLTITKEVVIVGGGTARSEGFLDYIIRVENAGNAPADNVVVTDTVPGLTELITGSAQINGATAGVNVTGNTITADYSDVYGILPPGDAFLLTFRVRIDSQAMPGDTVTNTANVSWNSGAPPDFNSSESASVDVGGAPGVANINGRIWFDGNHDRVFGDATDAPLAGWVVSVHVNNSSPSAVDTPLAQALTDDQGRYTFNGLAPVEPGAPGAYTLTFGTPDDPALFPAGASVALGETVSGFGAPGLMLSRGLNIGAGRNAQNESLPVNPTGIVYNSVSREAVQGARISLLDADGNPLPEGCFNTPAHLDSQQGQITSSLGYYRFDLNFSGDSCPAGAANYSVAVEVLNEAGAYMRTESQVIPPEVGSLEVAACPDSTDDRLPSPPADTCEIQAQPTVPGPTIAPGLGTRYFLDWRLQPGPERLFNNHVPVDQNLGELVAITKETPLKNVVRGQLVPYTITVINNQDYPIGGLEIRDFFPPGFKYVERSATVDGVPREPAVNAETFTRVSETGTGEPVANESLGSGTLIWAGLALNPNATMTIKLLLVVGAGVGEAEYTNRAQAFITNLSQFAISGMASATVRVVPDPTFDCSDIIGRVFDDKNVNGYPDDGEPGIAGARVVTAQGLLTTADEHGRFHIACAVVPNPDRGSNFILKLDERSLPSGYRITTENPRVQRLTRGKVAKFNFGAAIHRVVRLDLADAAFEPGETEIRGHWRYVIDDLFEQLQQEPSVLRIAYLGDIESETLAKRRVKTIKQLIEQRWQALSCCYNLAVETEVFWRTGRPGQ